jgi:hypothetical protein
MPKRVLLFILVCLLAVTLGFATLTPLQALRGVRQGGYWIIAVTFVLFLIHLARSLAPGRATGLGRLSAWRWPALAVAAASVWIHLHEPREYKIVMDEVVLGGTAMTMHRERLVSVPVRGYEYGGNFDVYSSFVDKRPLLFPFLVATTHDLTGYRVSNALWLNTALTPLFMALLFAVAARLGGQGAGYSALALVATLPLVAQNFTSHGFECLNLTMILLALWLGMRLLERPEDVDRLAAFVLSGVLLAQTRYESVLFVMPVGVLVLTAWWRTRTVILPWGALFAPLLMLPVPWLMNVFKVASSSWQLTDIEGAESPFGLRYFYDNIGHALAHYLDFSGAEPNSAILFVLGALAAGFVVLRLWREQGALFRRSPNEAATMVFWLALGLHTAVILCYFWGRFNDPIVRRLSLPSYLWLLFGLLLIWPHLVKHRHAWRILTFVALAWCAVFTTPAVARHRWTQENFAARTNAWLGRWAEALPEGERVFVIDASSTLVWIQHRQSAISIPGLQATSEKFLHHWRQGTWAGRVYLVQRIGTDWENPAGVPALGDDFASSLTLEPVAEKFFTPSYRVRLSRVTAVDAEKFTEDMARRAQLVAISASAQKEAISADSERLEEWFKNLP